MQQFSALLLEYHDLVGLAEAKARARLFFQHVRVHALGAQQLDMPLKRDALRVDPGELGPLRIDRRLQLQPVQHSVVSVDGEVREIDDKRQDQERKAPALGSASKSQTFTHSGIGTWRPRRGQALLG